MQRARVRIALRWSLTTVGVAALVLLMLHLSSWQWHKHVARDSAISRQQQNLAAPTTSLPQALTTSTVTAAEEWRQVRVRGTFDAAHQVVVTLRTVGGVPGSEVLTPLRTAGGVDVLVDRGFYAIPDDAVPGSPGPAPAPPTGTVTVTGYLRVSEAGSRAPAADGRQLTITAVEPAVLAARLPYRVLDGYLLLDGTSPAGRADLLQPTPPTYDSGPYLSYSVQWVIFCVIAVGGLAFLAIDEFGGGRLLSRLREPVPRAAVGAGGAAGAGGEGPGPGPEPGGVLAPAAGPSSPVVLAVPATAPARAVPAGPRPGAVPATTVLAGSLGGGRSRPVVPADWYDDDPEPDDDREPGPSAPLH